MTNLSDELIRRVRELNRGEHTWPISLRIVQCYYSIKSGTDNRQKELIRLIYLIPHREKQLYLELIMDIIKYVNGTALSERHSAEVYSVLHQDQFVITDTLDEDTEAINNNVGETRKLTNDDLKLLEIHNEEV